jgi:2-dehydropantoate 2-reductase
MNIVVFGAGAIGSLFGGLLSKNNNITLIGRKNHVKAIKSKGLILEGKTKLNLKINAFESVENVSLKPDVIILTVKSYDTESAIKAAKKIINKNTIVLSLQNGLDNIEKIRKVVNSKNIIAGTTTHGAIFSKYGVINHTGYGNTSIGELNGKETNRIKGIVKIFNEAGITTQLSIDILRELWVKAIVNSSINPLTAIFNCKNGYLLENPILENLVEKIALESTNIANSMEFKITYNASISKTKKVIEDTTDNYSSMYQSIKRGKKTEIDSINKKLVDVGQSKGVDCQLNKILTHLINSSG